MDRIDAKSYMKDLRDSAVAKAMNKDVGESEDAVVHEGYGGWRYEVDPGTNTIKIVGAPEGHKTGAVLTGGTAYDAIKGELEDKGLWPRQDLRGGHAPEAAPYTNEELGESRDYYDPMQADPQREEESIQEAPGVTAFRQGRDVVRDTGLDDMTPGELELLMGEIQKRMSRR